MITDYKVNIENEWKEKEKMCIYCGDTFQLISFEKLNGEVFYACTMDLHAIDLDTVSKY